MTTSVYINLDVVSYRQMHTSPLPEVGVSSQYPVLDLLLFAFLVPQNSSLVVGSSSFVSVLYTFYDKIHADPWMAAI